MLYVFPKREIDTKVAAEALYEAAKSEEDGFSENVVVLWDVAYDWLRGMSPPFIIRDRTSLTIATSLCVDRRYDEIPRRIIFSTGVDQEPDLFQDQLGPNLDRFVVTSIPRLGVLFQLAIAFCMRVRIRVMLSNRDDGKGQRQGKGEGMRLC